jgi:hypothetical protein
MNEDSSKLKLDFTEVKSAFAATEEAFRERQEQFWSSLTPAQQLDAFCAVARRIYKGEIEDRGTFRYVLYDVFGFGPDSYVAAQLAGYFAIHNSIYDADHDSRLLRKFCEINNIEGAEEKMLNFWKDF